VSIVRWPERVQFARTRLEQGYERVAFTPPNRALFAQKRHLRQQPEAGTANGGVLWRTEVDRLRVVDYRIPQGSPINTVCSTQKGSWRFLANASVLPRGPRVKHTASQDPLPIIASRTTRYCGSTNSVLLSAPACTNSRLWIMPASFPSCGAPEDSTTRAPLKSKSIASWSSGLLRQQRPAPTLPILWSASATSASSAAGSGWARRAFACRDPSSWNPAQATACGGLLHRHIIAAPVDPRHAAWASRAWPHNTEAPARYFSGLHSSRSLETALQECGVLNFKFGTWRPGCRSLQLVRPWLADAARAQVHRFRGFRRVAARPSPPPAPICFSGKTRKHRRRPKNGQSGTCLFSHSGSGIISRATMQNYNNPAFQRCRFFPKDSLSGWTAV